MEVSLLVPSMRQVLGTVGVCVLGVGGGVPMKGKAHLFFPPEALQRCPVEGLSLGALITS